MSLDGVFPGNKDAGYVMRRLIRRGWRYLKQIFPIATTKDALILLKSYLVTYENIYPELIKMEQNNIFN